MRGLKIKLVENRDEMKAAQDLRTKVFVQEQNVSPEEEFDGLDDTAIHAIALLNGKIVGTGRMLENGRGEVKIGRMAVEIGMRRTGVGSSILTFLEKQASQKRATKVILHAQSYVKDFYKKQGYVEDGQPFMEANIEHILMRKGI